MSEIPIHTTGHLARDPQRIYRKDGMAVTTILVDVAQRRWSSDGWKRAGSTRLECRAWAGLAEHIHASLTAGDRVVITGRLRQRPVNGGGHVFDVVLDDVGVSLVFCNIWPVKAEPVAVVESSEAVPA